MVGGDGVLTDRIRRAVNGPAGVEVTVVEDPSGLRHRLLPDARLVVCAARTAWAVTPATVSTLRLAYPRSNLIVSAPADHPAVAGAVELGFDDLLVDDETLASRVGLLVRSLEREGSDGYHRILGAAFAERVGLGLLTLEPDGTVLAATATAVRRLVGPGERLEGRSLRRLVDPPEPLAELLDSLLGESEVRTRKVRVLRGDEERSVLLHFMRRGGLIECLVEADRVFDRTERELVEQKKWFEELFENTPLAILMADADDRVLAVNLAFEHLFGWAAAEIAGKPLTDVLAPDGYEDEASALSRAALAGEPVSAETVRRHRRGRLVPVRVYGVPVLADGMRLGVFGFYVDMTERKRVEEALRQYAQRLEGMQRLDRAILAARSDRQLAEAALTTLRPLVPSDCASVLLFERSAGVARVVAARDEFDQGPRPGDQVDLSALTEMSELAAGPVRYLEDLEAMGDPPAMVQTLREAGVASVLTLPLAADGDLIGVMNLGSRRPVAFERDHIVVAREVADQLAIAMRQSAHGHRARR